MDPLIALVVLVSPILVLCAAIAPVVVITALLAAKGVKDFSNEALEKLAFQCDIC